jgi:hypothetical protein
MCFIFMETHANENNNEIANLIIGGGGVVAATRASGSGVFFGGVFFGGAMLATFGGIFFGGATLATHLLGSGEVRSRMSHFIWLVITYPKKKNKKYFN